MNKVIDLVAMENNLDMVLNDGTSSTDIRYINKTLNISDLVVKKLVAGE